MAEEEQEEILGTVNEVQNIRGVDEWMMSGHRIYLFFDVSHS